MSPLNLKITTILIDFDTNIYYYDEAAANKVVRFIEKYITHVKGELAGQHIKLEKWQKEDIIYPLFGIKNKSDGLRRFRTAYVEIPRKNAKSTLGAAIALYLLLSDSEPGAEIYSAAGDVFQARIIFDIAKGMVEQSETLSFRCKAWQYSITPKKKTSSFYKVISAEAKTKFGFNAHGILFDELFVQPNRELWDALTTSTGSRRQPITFATTTAGFDKETICYEIHEYATKVQQNIIRDDSFLPVLYSAEMDADIYSVDTWKIANPGYGTIVKSEFIKEQVNKIKNQPSFESTFRRLHLNQWVGSAETWIPDDVWTACSGGPIFDGPCYGGVDLSTVGDISAYVLFWPKTNSVKCYFFVPEDSVADRSRREGINYDVWVKGHMTATPGNVIDYSYILNAMVESREMYDVKNIGFDRYLIQDLGNKFSQADIDLSRWPLLPIGQGYISMSEPTKIIERLAYSGELRHGGNPVLRWMCSNIQIESDAAGNIKMSKKKSREKIDGMVALAMAIASWGGAEPEFRSRYEDNPEIDTIQL